MSLLVQTSASKEPFKKDSSKVIDHVLSQAVTSNQHNVRKETLKSNNRDVDLNVSAYKHLEDSQSGVNHPPIGNWAFKILGVDAPYPVDPNQLTHMTELLAQKVGKPTRPKATVLESEGDIMIDIPQTQKSALVASPQTPSSN